jgi:hypothetical protein
MKFLLSALAAAALAVKAVDGYVSPTPHSSQATAWTPKSFAQAPVTVDVEGMFRNEYIAWAKSHGKTTDEARFQIFKQNFMLQMQHNKKTGEFHDLNEHGDMTEAEFKAMMNGPATASVTDVVHVVTPHTVADLATPKVSPPARIMTSAVMDAECVHAELVFDEATTAASAPQQQAVPRVTVLGQSNQRFAKVNPPRALESISTPTRTSRKQYFTGGTQILGVKSNPNVVRWEPGMPR